MPEPAPKDTASQQRFKSSPQTTQEIIKAIMPVERKEMHKKKRDDIHVRITQIIKNHVTEDL